MPDPYDLFAKDALELLLADAGVVERHAEVAAPAQYIDAVFTPSSAGRPLLRRRGVLGRMASRTCAFECAHHPPSLSQLRDLARKHLAWHHSLTLHARRDRPRARVPLPPLYVICAGRPTTALSTLAAKPMRAWPPGFYEVARALVGMRIVVVGELPVTRDTLPLRLMGRARVLLSALAELDELPPGTWERSLGKSVVDFGTRRKRQEGPMSERIERIKKSADRIINQAVAVHARTMLLRLIERRKVTLTKARRKLINACVDLPTLERWLDNVADGLDMDAPAREATDPHRTDARD